MGLLGKPNAGKSTFFSASTESNAEIANYPFTTIESNKGMAYIRDKCPHEELGTKCDPNNSICINGTRFVPTKIMDVAGLVPNAYKGKGLGNEFLDQIRQANALIHVIDTSGSTNSRGEPIDKGKHDPKKDIEFLEKEIKMWIFGIIKEKWSVIHKNLESERKTIKESLKDILSGIGVTKRQINQVVNEIKKDPLKWEEKEIKELAKKITEINKPILLALNKIDITPKEKVKELNELDYPMVPTSAEAELVLKKMNKEGIIDYVPGDSDFKINNPKKLNKNQRKGLEKIRDKILKEYGSTGVQKSLEKTVRDLLNQIVVYPVEDSNDYTNKDGDVLPDAYLIKKNSSPRDLAYKIHTDIGKNYLYAINAKTGRRISDEYRLKNGDVIKIVSSNK